MKTAMELLIEKIDKMESKNISVIRIWATELLEFEKKQITDAFDEANTELHNADGSFITGKQYYDGYKNINNNAPTYL